MFLLFIKVISNNVHYFQKMDQGKGCDSSEMLFILAVYDLSMYDIALTQGHALLLFIKAAKVKF